MIYKRHQIKKTKQTTTLILPKPFGKLGTYQKIAELYEIEGQHKKAAGKRPFLTSIKACKEFINDCRS